MHTIFLVYANIPLRGIPANLLTITQTIDERPPMLNPWHLAGQADDPLEIKPFALHGEIIQWIIYFAKYTLPEAHAALADMTQARPRPELEIAFEAVHGYEDGYCFDDTGQPPGWYASRCLTIPERKTLIYDETLYGPEDLPGRLKCHECDQFYFQAALKCLAEGEAIKDIPGLAAFINQRMFFAPMFDMQGGGLTWKTGPEYPEFPYRHVFNNYLRSIIAHSFYDFSTNFNQKQLRICQQCNNFYISKTLKQSKFCSDNCKYAWHNKKKIESGELKKYKRKKFGWTGKD